MIRQEISKSQQSSRFNLNVNPNVRHTGIDSPPINQNSITGGIRVTGGVTFETETTYKINISFNPTAVWMHGNVTGPRGERFIIVGNAQLGTSYYLQPESATSVKIGGLKETIIQSNTYFGSDSLGGLHTLEDDGHIFNIFYLGSLLVRGTITDYNSSSITISFTGGTNLLTPGWTVNASLTIT